MPLKIPSKAKLKPAKEKAISEIDEMVALQDKDWERFDPLVKRLEKKNGVQRASVEIKGKFMSTPRRYIKWYKGGKIRQLKEDIKKLWDSFELKHTRTQRFK